MLMDSLKPCTEDLDTWRSKGPSWLVSNLSSDVPAHDFRGTDERECADKSIHFVRFSPW